MKVITILRTAFERDTPVGCVEALVRRRNRLLPLAATAIVSRAVDSIATALKLPLWGDIRPGWMGIGACHSPRCVAAVMLGVPEVLAAFALQQSLRCLVHLHFNPQVHRLYEVWCKWTVFSAS